MAREVNRVLWAQWRQRFARQRASGLSIAAFCREEGVSQATFYAWRRKLKASVSRRPASGHRMGFSIVDPESAHYDPEHPAGLPWLSIGMISTPGAGLRSAAAAQGSKARKLPLLVTSARVPLPVQT